MADVFISYSRKDVAFAEALGVALESERLSVWRDQKILRPADDFSQKIKSAVRSSSSVIVIWSKDSRESDWVHREAAIADYARKLVQVCIDDEPPPEMYSAKLASHFSGGSVPIDRDSKAFRSLVLVLKQMRRNAQMSRLALVIGILLAVAVPAVIYLMGMSSAYSQPAKVCAYEKVETQTFYWPVPANSGPAICEAIAASISENAEYYRYKGRLGRVQVHYLCMVDDKVSRDARCGADWQGTKVLQEAQP